MKTNQLVMTSALSLMLVACGGGSDSPTQTTQPIQQQNQAPNAVADTAQTTNNTPVTIDVLANDSDANGDTLSLAEIVTSPTSGTVNINGNSVEYTPNPFSLGNDSFTYEVSDGQTTSQATVTVTNTQSISISGIVTDSPIAGATVSVTLPNQQYNAVADDEGNYQVDITLSSPDDVIVMHALGAESQQQSNVEFQSFMGTSAELIEAYGETRLVTPDTSSKANITNVSTALLLLANEQNNGLQPSNLTEFDTAVNAIDANEFVELAAFINLLVDNPDYDIPEGQTSLSMFTDGAQNGVKSVIQDYLVSVGATDENGEPSAEYSQALESAIEATIANSDTLPKLDTELFAGKMIVALPGDVVEGFLPQNVTLFEFNDAGVGSIWEQFRYDISSNVRGDFTSQQTDGHISLEFEDFSPIYNITYDEDRIRQVYGDNAAEYADTFNVRFVGVREYEKISSIILSPLAQTKDTLIVQSKRSKYTEIAFGEKVFTRPLSDEIQTLKLRLNSDSLLTGLSEADVQGKWALPINYQFNTILDEKEAIGSPSNHLDIFSLIPETSTTGKYSLESMDWAISESGVINLIGQSKRFEIQPIQAIGPMYLAIYSSYEDDVLETRQVRQIARFEENPFAVSELMTELPVVLADYGSQGYDADEYENGQWKSFNIRQEPILNADGTVELISTGSENGNWYFMKGAGFNGFGGTWQETEDGLSFRWHAELGSSRSLANEVTQWFPIGKAGENKFYVVEIRIAFFERGVRNMRFDDELDFEAFTSEPRIDVIIPTDLSQYEVEWQNTIDRGEFPGIN